MSAEASLLSPPPPHSLPSPPSLWPSARRQVVYPPERLGVNSPLAEVLQEREPFSLLHINRKLTLEPKV